MCSSEIVLIDEIKDSTSKEYLENVKLKLQEEISGINCKIGKKLCKDKLNIRLIHNKEFYVEGSDPHQDNLEGYIVQHITYEKYPNSGAAVFVILKELAIKQDIKNGKFSLIDWSSFGYKDDWIFAIAREGKYLFMTVHPDGTFKIEELKFNLFTMHEYYKYMEYFGDEETTQGLYKDVEYLVKDADGNINLIQRTNLHTMPEIQLLGDVLKQSGEDVNIDGNILMEAIDAITTKNKNYFELIAMKDNLESNKKYTREDIFEMIKSKGERKVLSVYLENEKGIVLKAYLRGAEDKETYYPSILDINYCELTEDQAYYAVGTKSKNLQSNIDKGSVIRKVQAVDGSKLIFKELLPLMGVEFIRYGQLTVKVMPVGYLRK